MIIRKINKLLFIIWYRVLCSFTWIITWFKFKLNGVVFKNDYICRGVPTMHISLRGHLLIGSGFQMNSGALHNRIGRPQKCSFVVGNDAYLIIDDNVGISSTVIVCRSRIEIASDVRIGGGVVIYDTDFHSLNVLERTDRPENKDNVVSKPVRIEKGAFIGAHSMILKGVTIGKNSIIGAGSVVTKSIPANEIWAGNPAKHLKSLT